MGSYTTPAAIASALGVTLTPEQTVQAQQLADAATAFIDRYTGQSWQGVSPVAGELDQVIVPAPASYGAAAGVFLQRRPAVAVTAVSVRSAVANDPGVALDPAAYELVDPTNGVVLLPGYGVGWLTDWPGPGAWAVVDYSYASAVPADITVAATAIASGAMAQTIAAQQAGGLIQAHPELAGLESISVGQNDVSVRLGSATRPAGAASASGSAWAAPGSAVAAILDGYRRVVIA